MPFSSSLHLIARRASKCKRLYWGIDQNCGEDLATIEKMRKEVCVPLQTYSPRSARCQIACMRYPGLQQCIRKRRGDAVVEDLTGIPLLTLLKKTVSVFRCLGHF